MCTLYMKCLSGRFHKQNCSNKENMIFGVALGLDPMLIYAILQNKHKMHNQIMG